MRDPALSVVMSVYNEQTHVREAVDSILAQTFGDFEFIIIDDGSTDDTGVILADAAQRDARVKVIKLEHVGRVPALNRGFAEASAPLTACMDGDDIAMPKRFEQQVKFFAEHSHVDIVGTAMEAIDSSGQILDVNPVAEDDATIRAMMRESQSIYHPTAMLRTEAFRKYGTYRAAFVPAEDHDLWLRMLPHCTVANINKPLHRRRSHDEQVSVKYLHQQVYSTLAARRLAERGDDTEPAHIDRAMLISLGIDERTIDMAIARAQLIQINMATRCGRCDAARQMLHALQTETPRPVLATIDAEIGGQRTRLLAREGRPVSAMASATATVLRHPLQTCARVLRGREAR